MDDVWHCGLCCAFVGCDSGPGRRKRSFSASRRHPPCSVSVTSPRLPSVACCLPFTYDEGFFSTVPDSSLLKGSTLRWLLVRQNASIFESRLSPVNVSAVNQPIVSQQHSSADGSVVDAEQDNTITSSTYHDQLDEHLLTGVSSVDVALSPIQSSDRCLALPHPQSSVCLSTPTIKRSVESATEADCPRKQRLLNFPHGDGRPLAERRRTVGTDDDCDDQPERVTRPSQPSSGTVPHCHHIPFRKKACGDFSPPPLSSVTISSHVTSKPIGSAKSFLASMDQSIITASAMKDFLNASLEKQASSASSPQ